MVDIKDEADVEEAARLLENVRDRSRCGVCKQYWDTLIEGQRGLLKLLRQSEQVAHVKRGMKPVEDAVKKISRGIEEADQVLGEATGAQGEGGEGEGGPPVARGLFREIVDGMRPREFLQQGRELMGVGEGLLGRGPLRRRKRNA